MTKIVEGVPRGQIEAQKFITFIRIWNPTL
jgi:hypothetical protein